jgi:hypothetical protein
MSCKRQHAILDLLFETHKRQLQQNRQRNPQWSNLEHQKWLDLPKPPQFFAKVRELVIVCQFRLLLFARKKTGPKKCKYAHCMYWW